MNERALISIVHVQDNAGQRNVHAVFEVEEEEVLIERGSCELEPTPQLCECCECDYFLTDFFICGNHLTARCLFLEPLFSNNNLRCGVGALVQAVGVCAFGDRSIKSSIDDDSSHIVELDDITKFLVKFTDI